MTAIPDDDGAPDDEFFARLAQLNDRFAAALPATLARLLEAHNAFDVEHPVQAVIDDVHATLHTLAGSSATFGFHGLGHAARDLEQRLLVLTAFDAVAPGDWADWLAHLRDFIDRAGRDPKGL